jgi:hypothetical protein
MSTETLDRRSFCWARLGRTIEVQSGIHYTNICCPGSGHIGQGRHVQGTHCTKDAFSKIHKGKHCLRDKLPKGPIIQRTHCSRDELYKKRTHCPRNALSETFRLGSYWLEDTSDLLSLIARAIIICS